MPQDLTAKKVEDQRNYHRQWYLKNKIKKLIQNKEWYLNNKSKHRSLVRNYLIKNPWVKIASSARTRCKPNGSYGIIGIKCFITVEEVKKLWFRDKAYLMVRPSIDRKNTSGDYTFKNCRFIELLANLKRSKKEYRAGWFKNGQCKDCGTTSSKHQAKGLCQTCYTRMKRKQKGGNDE